jgi:large subunit ribosomal protein L10
MPKTRQQKQELVEKMSAKFKGGKAAIFANYCGLNATDTELLRRKCRLEDVDFIALKKTLLTLVLKDNGIENFDAKDMEGSLGVAISKDEVSAAKILKEFAKTHDKVTFMGGVLEGKLLQVAEVKALASLPSKQELLAKLVGTLNAPLTGFVNVLQGNIRGLVNVLNAVKNTK